MSNVAIVYHSGYGHTKRMAEAVAAGAGAQLIAIDAEGNLPAGGWEALQAAEAIKCLTGIGLSLAGRLLLFDALRTEWRSIRVPRDPQCSVCGAAT